jgi:hypothetical protein
VVEHGGMPKVRQGANSPLAAIQACARRRMLRRIGWPAWLLAPPLRLKQDWRGGMRIGCLSEWTTEGCGVALSATRRRATSRPSKKLWPAVREKQSQHPQPPCPALEP